MSTTLTKSVAAIMFSFALVSATSAGNILWVSELRGGEEWDIGWVELLEGAGHTVDTHYNDFEEIGNAEIDLMNESDLVIVSRSVNSSNYYSPLEVDDWNMSVTKPLLLMTPYLTRSNRWLWLNTDVADVFTEHELIAVQPDHPIFNGIQTPVDMWDEDRISPDIAQGIQTNGVFDAGNGTVLATTETDEVWIAYWEAGVEFYDGADQIAGGERLYFALGNEQIGNDLWGGNNSTPEGEQLFLNAVSFMLGELGGGGEPLLQAGDANQDFEFNQLDLVQVQVAAKYLTGNPATWGEGDWDGAPGGEQGSPPPGNGMFDQLDIIAALGANTYLTGPYAAINGGGVAGDEQTSIIYNPGTGEVAVDAPASTELTSINIDSAASIFTGDAAMNLGGSFDNDADNNIFKATFGSSFGSLSFGNVARTGLSQEEVMNDLTVIGSLAGGGDLGAVDLIYVPEPATVCLLMLGLAGLIGYACRRNRFAG